MSGPARTAVPSADDLDLAARWVAQSRRIVVLTGAGISTDSGIPDFRGPQGVWTRDPDAEKLSDIRYYLADSRIRAKAWRARLEHPAWGAKPNAGHRAIVALERQGRLHALITQNIDELHQQAGNDPAKIIEVHGTVHRVMCWQCGQRTPMSQTLERLHAGEDDPACRDCGGILKSDTISFGQQLVPEVIERALTVATEADLLIAVGSTLAVYPVAGAVPLAREAGAHIIIVNGAPTEMDEVAHLVLRGNTSEILPRIVGELPAATPDPSGRS